MTLFDATERKLAEHLPSRRKNPKQTHKEKNQAGSATVYYFRLLLMNWDDASSSSRRQTHTSAGSKTASKFRSAIPRL